MFFLLQTHYYCSKQLQGIQSNGYKIHIYHALMCYHKHCKTYHVPPLTRFSFIFQANDQTSHRHLNAPSKGSFPNPEGSSNATEHIWLRFSSCRNKLLNQLKGDGNSNLIVNLLLCNIRLRNFDETRQCHILNIQKPKDEPHNF